MMDNKDVKVCDEIMNERTRALEQYYTLKKRFRCVQELLAFKDYDSEWTILVARDLLTDTHFIVYQGKEQGNVIVITEAEFKDIEFKYQTSVISPDGGASAFASVREIIWERRSERE